jgi:hypothetical protein
MLRTLRVLFKHVLVIIPTATDQEEQSMAQRHWNDLYHHLLAPYHLDCTRTHHYITCISFPLHSVASKKELALGSPTILDDDMPQYKEYYTILFPDILLHLYI